MLNEAKKRYILISIIAGLGVQNVHAATTNIAPQNCQTLNCVRSYIDMIDNQIITLIGQRLAYVKMAASIKGNTQAVVDPQREAAILTMVGQQAERAGYPPTIAQSVFKTILAESDQYELSQVPQGKSS